MRRILPALLGFFAIFLTTTFIFRTETKNVSAALATHLVISEVQIAGGTTTDEFVELYNPTNNPQGMTGWTIYRKTPTGTIEIPIATGSGSIPSHGFYLFANSNFDGGVSPDTSYTENIAAGNSIILRDNGNVLVDLVGMGASATSESATIADPITNRSIERKANSSSTEADMGSGGVDETAGNGEDTDNNSVDFVRHVSPNVSQPQNSLSAVELVEVSPTPTLTPTPTEEPSPSPTPTAEPSASPTPTPTIEPTPTPTVEPTPTLIPTPTIPAPRLLFRGPNISCSLNYKVVRFFRSNIFWPFLACSRT